MRVADLLTDEIEYELRIRGVALPTSATTKERRKALSAVLKKERLHNLSISTIDPNLISEQDELQICNEKAQELEGISQDPYHKSNPKLRSRCEHLSRRVARLETNEGNQDVLSTLKNRVENLCADSGSSSDEEDPEPNPTSHSTQAAGVEHVGYDAGVQFPNLSPVPPVSSNQRGNFPNKLPAASDDLEKTFADKLVQMLDVTLQRLDDNRGHTTPVRKWGVTFSGQIDGTSVVTFLNKVEEKRSSMGMSFDKLLANATDLFTGDALVWYRSIRPEVRTWDELVKRIRSSFLPTNFELSLWDEIRSKRQGPKESCVLYIASMRELFSRFVQPPREAEQVSCIIANLQSFYATQLSLINVHSLSQLSDMCTRLENTRLNNERHQVRQLSAVETLVTPKPVTSPSVATIFKSPSNEKKIRKKFQCWNCGEEGHGFTKCTKDLKVFCFLCGAPGVTVETCNRQHLNSQRRSRLPDAPSQS